jgi:hypothetical protein
VGRGFPKANHKEEPEMAKRQWGVVLGFLNASLAACNAPVGENWGCTDEQRLYGVTVLDGTGMPVTEAEIEVLNARTGHRLAPEQGGASGPGYFVVLTSGEVRKSDVRDGDSLEVFVSHRGQTAAATYVVRADFCHPTKLEGPEELVLE